MEIGKDKSFMPYAYHVDYHLLWFRCTKSEDGFFKVIINERKNETKLLSKEDKNLLFVTRQNLILSSFSVNFDAGHNSIRKEPCLRSEIMDYGKEQFYLPVEISGDWLKVKWGEINKEHFGYIRWKHGNKLYVELNFFA